MLFGTIHDSGTFADEFSRDENRSPAQGCGLERGFLLPQASERTQECSYWLPMPLVTSF